MRFSPDSVTDLDDGRYFFDCAMVSTCRPVFDHMDDNYEVAQELIRAGVIGSEDEEDSESCAIVVTFLDHARALAFLDRLNAYLAQREEEIRRVYPAAFSKTTW